MNCRANLEAKKVPLGLKSRVPSLMPFISKHLCDKCDFCLPTGWGGHMYVTDKDGERIICPHPGEGRTVERVLTAENPGITQKGIAEIYKLRTGHNSDAVCRHCLYQFELDVKRDQRVCPQCGSADIGTVKEMLGKPCPRCKAGKIRAIPTGMIA